MKRDRRKKHVDILSAIMLLMNNFNGHSGILDLLGHQLQRARWKKGVRYLPDREPTLHSHTSAGSGYE